MSIYDQTLVCEVCDRSEYITSVRVLADWPDYEIDEDYEVLCRDCIDELNTYGPESLTDEELIAAIVSDSIGYAGPRHAANHVSDWHEGKETVHCERGHAVFGGDLNKLIERAAQHWAYQSEERKAKLLKSVDAWKEIESRDQIASMSLSMMWPTGI